jgi:hypothetical protein
LGKSGASSNLAFRVFQESVTSSRISSRRHASA